jgi:hypothetical protein
MRSQLSLNPLFREHNLKKTPAKTKQQDQGQLNVAKTQSPKSEAKVEFKRQYGDQNRKDDFRMDISDVDI